VIGGYDFGDNDADPRPGVVANSSHGTSCAGIAAGDLGPLLDYIGGVAYGAKLYALKIAADTNSQTDDSKIIAAWDWCVTHKNDDPNHPLLIISTSVGSGRFFASCDGSRQTLATAANNAVAAA